MEARKEARKEAKLGVAGGGGREEEEERSGGGLWAWMIAEILTSIFLRIPRDELARSVPGVCRWWREVAEGPAFWKDIELEKWCRRVNYPESIDPVVRRLLRRSKGVIERLSVYRISDSSVPYIAHFGKNLKVLKIPVSDVSDRILEMHGHSFVLLNELDISYCTNISYKGIEVLGKHCKSLVQLRRNMSPALPSHYETLLMNGVVLKVDENEAMAIANSMVNLKHLELGYGRFSEKGVEEILKKCTALRFLDIHCCSNVTLTIDIKDMCDSLITFVGPQVGFFDFDLLDEFSSDSDYIEFDSESDAD